MGNSWSHAVRMLTDAERSHLAAMIEHYGSPRFYACATRNCIADATHKTSYLYVTGRRGRISQAERLACTEHATRFAKKHGCDMPEAPASREFILKGGSSDGGS